MKGRGERMRREGRKGEGRGPPWNLKEGGRESEKREGAAERALVRERGAKERT